MVRPNSVLKNELKRPDGALLRWGAFGVGATVIFVPGLGGDSLCWGAVPRLVTRQGREVVLYDPRGLGSSTLGVASATMETLRDDLLALVKLQHKPVTLFGWSMGAQLAMMAALQGGFSMVNSLVLAAWTPDHRALARQMPEIFEPLCDSNMPLDSWCLHMVSLLGLSKTGAEAMIRHLSSCREGLAFHQKALALGPQKVLEFATLSCPVAVLMGKNDPLIPYSETVDVASEATWNIEILSAGHGLIYQKPAEVAQWVSAHIL